MLCGVAALLLPDVQVLDFLGKNATNPAVLSGDVHNAYVWSLFGTDKAKPVRLANWGLGAKEGTPYLGVPVSYCQQPAGMLCTCRLG